ncbi:hypothetical protein HNQ79_004976 [Streptomyces candidus]|uniref:Uncharacterized protein n=1 Tax=Streptomyces candidus TaxID=67283 RepID=A0A7X0LSH2_9ACTN|nr:hypothetical protein [Streptomyces candidus]
MATAAAMTIRMRVVGFLRSPGPGGGVCACG